MTEDQQKTLEAAPDVKPVPLVVRVAVTALLDPEPGGGFSIVVPALPGCFTEAETIEEARVQVRDAAEGRLAVMHDRAATRGTRIGDSPPPGRSGGEPGPGHLPVNSRASPSAW